MRARFTGLMLAAALIALVTACSSSSLTIAEYANLMCGDDAITEVDESDYGLEEGDFPTNGQMVEALEDVRDELKGIDPPGELEDYHRLQVTAMGQLIDALEDEDPDETVLFTSLFGVGAMMAVDQTRIAQEMSDDLLAEMNDNGCDLSREDPFSFGDDEQE